jgi:membrane peptidoglycan carboxypeptidase
VIQDGVAAEVTRILGENMHSGTGTGALMSDDRPEAGKTGTTDNHTDAWFCGFTPTLATCVWIGYPDETKSLYNIEGVGAVSGPTLPADIWHNYMDSALEGTPPVSFAAPKKTREKRATSARLRVAVQFSDRTRDFIDFVLDHYVNEGVEELDPQKLPDLLQLKYGGVNDALKAIGATADGVRDAFFDFQKFLYEESVA